jgi:hypothetical protein
MSGRGGRRAAYVLGVLLVASAAAHAFAGWPPLGGALRETGVDPNIIAALSVGWWFGSVAMATFGVLVLLAARRLHGPEPLARRVGLVIGLAYLLFGIAASVYRFPNPHFLFFVAMGAALCGVALAAGRARERAVAVNGR